MGSHLVRLLAGVYEVVVLEGLVGLEVGSTDLTLVEPQVLRVLVLLLTPCSKKIVYENNNFRRCLQVEPYTKEPCQKSNCGIDGICHNRDFLKIITEDEHVLKSMPHP